MKKKWDYAELSKSAAEAGGPEKYLEMIENASRNVGKKEMYPWIGVAAAGALILTVTTVKLIDYFKTINRSKQAEIEMLKEEIINGIKEYDAEQERKVEDIKDEPEDVI